ncbi:MAG TPA: hypothetical protein VN886_10250 [Acidimicrobiales bacterium]|nr:hypothetical protein [Acidimicrobiales bacterium]
MDITLQIHVEAAEREIVWWAESDQLPGVSVAAPSLMEMREELDHVLADLSEEGGEPIRIGTEILADAEEVSHAMARDDGDESTSGLFVGSRQVLVEIGA